MSSSPTREVARRVFAREFNDATHTFKQSDDDLAPRYALLPTGKRANRVFVVCTLTQTEDVGEDSEIWQGRIVDPDGGTFFTYAGQYQPDAASALRELDPPEYVAVVGKPDTFETDDGSVNVSMRPESITVVDETTRNRWVVETAERTIERVREFEEDAGDGVQMAREEYDLPVENYRRVAVEALEGLDAEQTGSSTD
jgi:RPA family protein